MLFIIIIMTIYQCYRCGYETHIKTIMLRHINRKNICKPKKNNVILKECKNFILDGFSYEEYYEEIMSSKMSSKSSKMSSKNEKLSSFCHQNVIKNDNICNFCEKSLSSRQALWRHLKTCKEKKNDDTVKESMTELARLLNEKDKQLKDKENELIKKDNEHKKQLLEELDKRDKQIQELIKKAGLVNMSNSNNTTNIQNNFKLLNYKETDTSHLTENDYVRCLEHYNFCVPHLIRKIHFNPKKPENHNIYISNLKNSYVMIYMNNKWKVKNRDETISRIIDDKQIILEKKIQEWVESGIQYPKVMAKFSRYLEKREENDVINAIKEDIKLMLYNNRNMIIESKKKLVK